VARQLVDRGARQLVLLGRSEPSAEAREALEAMRASGARVQVAQADVSSEPELDAVLASARPLRGIVHCAGRLDDGILLQQSDERFRSVMAPKIDGSWNLHRLTQDDPLDFFVLFSSAASVIGSPGQGNYAAANAFLDALAHHRQAQGLPAQSINWGPWSETGLAARPDRGGRLAAQSMESLTPRQGVAAFDRLLDESAAQPSVLNVPRGGWRKLHDAIGEAPLLAQLAGEDAEAAPAERGASLADEIRAAAPEARHALLEAMIREQVARVLRIPPGKLDVDRRLDRMGIDSLMAVELKNRIEERCRVTLPLLQLVQGPTVANLTARLLERMIGDGDGLPAAETDGNDRDDRSGSVLLSLLSMKDQERDE
jgi:NAD(P)-dependent dehydrogenase (short-subunit alcohol dehydrogenase family)/acyl carrier protein